MKKICFVILLLVMSVLLTACNQKEFPNETETVEIENTDDSPVVDTEETTGIHFYASDVVFCEVPQETYEQSLSGGHVVGILSSKEEWLEWIEGNWAEKKTFSNYNEALFESNCLLIYQCSLKQRGTSASGIKSIQIDDKTIQITHSEKADYMLDGAPEDAYYIPYQICWMKKQEMTNQLYEKYKMDHFYPIDDKNAYYIYLNLYLHQVEVEYTHDGGNLWEIYTYKTDEVWGDGYVYASFMDKYTAYILRTSDPGLGQMMKVLYYMGDSERYIQEVRYLTTDIENYPVGLDFYSKDVGYIITNYHNTQNFLYRTEDGGKTWVVQTVPEPDYEYSYMQGVHIECISDTEARVVVEVVTVKGAHQLEYVTQDGGKTWYEPLYMYDDESVEN